MTDRLELLAQHRERLRAEIAVEREYLARAAQRLQPPLRKLDQVREDLRFFRERYLYLLIPVGLLIVLNPHRTLKLALGALSLWRTFQRAQGAPEERLAQTVAVAAARRAGRL